MTKPNFTNISNEDDLQWKMISKTKRLPIPNSKFQYLKFKCSRPKMEGKFDLSSVTVLSPACPNGQSDQLQDCRDFPLL